MPHHSLTSATTDLGTSVGRRQAFGRIAGKCSATGPECLKQIRERKRYESVAAHWEELCSGYLGLSPSHPDRLIQQLHEFGAAYCELSQIVRILSGHSIEYKGQTIPISQENGGRISEGSRLAAAGRRLRDSKNCKTNLPTPRQSHKSFPQNLPQGKIHDLYRTTPACIQQAEKSAAGSRYAHSAQVLFCLLPDAIQPRILYTVPNLTRESIYVDS